MSATKARIMANMRYRDKAYDQLSISIPKGKRAEYATAAKKRGMSLASLIKTSVAEYIQNHPVADTGE